MPLRLPSSVFGSLASLALVGAAHAFPTFAGHVTINDSYGSTAGGEFRMWANSDFQFVPLATGTPFQFGLGPTRLVWESFCVERFEEVNIELTNLRADLNTETVATRAEYAGGMHGGFNDALDPLTAYLYDHFIRQTLLTPYSYFNEAQRTLDANDLQTAIWFIEEEDDTPLTGKALDFYNEAVAAVSSGAWVGLGDVRILNLYTVVGQVRTEYQDELVIVPTPGPLALLGLGALIACRRRR